MEHFFDLHVFEIKLKGHFFVIFLYREFHLRGFEPKQFDVKKTKKQSASHF